MRLATQETGNPVDEAPARRLRMVFLMRIPVCPTADCTASAEVFRVFVHGDWAQRFVCDAGHVFGPGGPAVSEPAPDESLPVGS